MLGAAVRIGFTWLGAFVIIGILGLASKRGTVQDVVVFSAVAATVLTVLDRIWAWLRPARGVSLGWGLGELVPWLGAYLVVLGFEYLFDKGEGRELFRGALIFLIAVTVLGSAIRFVGRGVKTTLGG